MDAARCVSGKGAQNLRGMLCFPRSTHALTTARATLDRQLRACGSLEADTDKQTRAHQEGARPDNV